jgi:hypothetical protein
VQHVVRVAPASEAERLDKQRLVLSVGEGGTILAVNPGASKALFGFVPEALVGRRLSAAVNVFEECEKQSGSDAAGLLTALGMRAVDGAADDAWRVGVTQPKRLDRAEEVSGLVVSGVRLAASGAVPVDISHFPFSTPSCDRPTIQAAASSSALAAALHQRNRDRPALMSVAIHMEEGEDGGDGGEAAADGGGHAAASSKHGAAAAAAAESGQRQERPALEVVLWRADTLSSVLEVDGQLEITRADTTAGLLFGVSHRALVKRDFRR